MILREGISNKWVIENGFGLVLCERYCYSEREAYEWANAYFSSWSPKISYSVIKLEKKNELKEIKFKKEEKEEPQLARVVNNS